MKSVLCLLDQRGAVREKQNIRDIPPAAQHIGKAGCSARFTGAGRHDEQTAPVSLRDIAAYGADRLFLIIAVGDFIVDLDGIEVFALRAAI